VAKVRSYDVGVAKHYHIYIHHLDEDKVYRHVKVVTLDQLKTKLHKAGITFNFTVGGGKWCYGRIKNKAE
jgi:hypothetical protein